MSQAVAFFLPGHSSYHQREMQGAGGATGCCLPLQKAGPTQLLTSQSQGAQKPGPPEGPDSRWGRQGDTCYVRCPTSEAVDTCVQEIQAR